MGTTVHRGLSVHVLETGVKGRDASSCTRSLTIFPRSCQTPDLGQGLPRSDPKCVVSPFWIPVNPQPGHDAPRAGQWPSPVCGFWQVGLDQQTVRLVCTNRRKQFLLDTADVALAE